MASQRPKRIVIVEKEHDTARLIKHYLEEEGFHTYIAGTGDEAYKLVASENPDLMTLGLKLPGINGLELCKALRNKAETALLPIIMLTEKSEESDIIVGLELGADDYMTKPFHPKVLVARVKALFRRLDRANNQSQATLTYGPLRMDLSRREVVVKDKEVPLTAKEFGLLEQLMRYPGEVLTRDMVLNTVWGYNYYGTTRTVDVHVRRLKLKAPLLNETILSVKSVGYKLVEQPLAQ